MDADRLFMVAILYPSIQRVNRRLTVAAETRTVTEHENILPTYAMVTCRMASAKSKGHETHLGKNSMSIT